MKTCTKCKEEKPLSEFYRYYNKEKGRDITRPDCNSCLRAYGKAYDEAHKEEKRARRKAYYHASGMDKKYREANKEKISATNKAYREANKDKIRSRHRKWSKKRRHEDPLWRLCMNTRSAVSRSFRKQGAKKDQRTTQILGCSMSEFETYIKKQFKEGMTLENYSEWELDHIVPLALAETKEDAIALNHYSNWRPLWKKENGSGGKWYKLDLDIVSPENKTRYKTIISRAIKRQI